MKQEIVNQKITELFKTKNTVTAQEAVYRGIPLVQAYSALNQFAKQGAVKMEVGENNKKSYTLIDEQKLLQSVEEKSVTKDSKNKSGKIEKEEIKPLKNPQQKGRDLSKYKFNGAEYNKGRLALAIITEYAKTKKPTLKQALTLFPVEIIPPYGTIAEIKEAKKMSKARPRFFLKDQELVRLKDCVIAVSNQWTSTRLDLFLGIVRKELKFSIK
jgi:Fe2+ or Zn2+ uptake regulation protein